MLSLQLKIQSRKINEIQIFGNSLAAEFVVSALFSIAFCLFAPTVEMSFKSIYEIEVMFSFLEMNRMYLMARNENNHSIQNRFGC